MVSFVTPARSRRLRLRTRANRDRVERLAARLTAAGLDVRVRDDETSMLWDKLALLTPMQRDQAAGRPLEIDAIGGAVLRRAAQAGIDVPVTARLVDELRSRT
jgi:ketopantoate reductase